LKAPEILWNMKHVQKISMLFLAKQILVDYKSLIMHIFDE
jgi:hypothetical protein